MKKLVPLVLGATLLAGGLAFSQHPSAEAAKPGYATLGTAADFELQGLDGKTHKLSDYKGKVRIVNFWATWCPPCRAEIPDFIKVQDAYKAKGVVFLGLSVDQGGPEGVKKFAEEKGINYTVVMADSKVVSDYGGIRGIPTTFVVDRQGNIVKKYVGAITKETLLADIKPLL